MCVINLEDEWTGHVARMGELSSKNTYTILIVKPEEKTQA
jgi:hypothetical protein